MVNCTYTDVRDIIDTGLADPRLTALIILADAEISARGLEGGEWDSNVKKKLSMLLTAELAAMNDVRSIGKSDYSAAVGLTNIDLAKRYRDSAEALIRNISQGDVGGPPRARVG